MAKLTKFSINPAGELVYRSTGAKARGELEVRGSNVYKNGRRVGTLSKELDRKTRNQIKKLQEKAKKATPAKRAQAKKKAKAKVDAIKKQAADQYGYAKKEKSKMYYGGLGSVFGGDDFGGFEPPTDGGGWGHDDDFIDAFGELVKNSMNKDLPQWLKSRIQALDNKAIYQAYQKNQYVFEVYFQYNPDGSLKSADNSARWVLSWVEQIEKMGVKE